MSLLRAGAKALTWSTLSEVSARVVAPLTFVVMARVLVPADFGIVAAATVVVSLGQAVAEGGFAKALVQRRDRVAEAAATAFWLNLALGMILVAVIWGVAGPLASFFDDSRVTSALLALSPLVVVQAVGAVPLALLQRELRFKPLFWGRAVGALFPALIGIPWALAGGGYWALVVGALGGQLSQAAVLWAMCGWRPAMTIDWPLAAELTRFARWAVLSAVFAWGYAWLDAVVIGHYLGTHDMGLYRAGNLFVTMVFGLLFAPMLPVLYSMFSRVSGDLPLLREGLRIVVRAVAIVALPIALLLFGAREAISSGLLGTRWYGASEVIGMLALGQAVSWIVSFNGELYRAAGKPEAEALAMGPLLIVYVLVYMLVVQDGLDSFLVARLALTLLGVAAQLVIARLLLGICFSVWARPIGAAMATIAVAVLDSPGASLVLIAFLLFTDWPFVRALWARWRRTAVR